MNKKLLITLAIASLFWLAVAALPPTQSEPVTVRIWLDGYGPVGSGFFVDDNRVMTAAHVVKKHDPNTLSVNGYGIEDVQYFGETDCAVLTVETPEAEESVAFAESRMGEKIVIKSRLIRREDPDIDLWSSGIVSTPVVYKEFFKSCVFLSDATQQPGMSGSAVVNKRNKVVGVLLGWSGEFAVCLDIQTVK